jgi:hypothetical protein
MSLVSDALRKARRDAADRGDNLRGPATPTTIVHLERPRARGRDVALVVMAVVVAAAAGGAGVWWVVGHRPGGDGPEPTSMGEINTSPPDDTLSPRELPPATESASQPTVSTPSETTGSPQTPRPSQPTDAPTSVHAPSSATAADLYDPAQTPADESPSNQPSAPPPGEVTAGDRHLVLDYIAYIPSDPFAQINGTEVRVGSELDDLVVKAISASEVVLLDPAGEEIHLRAR